VVRSYRALANYHANITSEQKTHATPNTLFAHIQTIGDRFVSKEHEYLAIEYCRSIVLRLYFANIARCDEGYLIINIAII